jgi:outer membrane protein
VNEFLKHHKTKSYNFVLGYQKGGGILYANDSLDITREVVVGLNNEYKSKSNEK